MVMSDSFKINCTLKEDWTGQNIVVKIKKKKTIKI